MVKTELTDEALGNAARLVRDSMLSSLREEEMPAHEFSEDFRESLLEEVRRNERKPVRTQPVLRRCIAALLSVVVGLSLFFGLNTEARAAALQWAKKTAWGRTVFSFFGDAEKALPKFEVTWLPEGNFMFRPFLIVRYHERSIIYEKTSYIHCPASLPVQLRDAFYDMSILQSGNDSRFHPKQPHRVLH